MIKWNLILLHKNDSSRVTIPMNGTTWDLVLHVVILSQHSQAHQINCRHSLKDHFSAIFFFLIWYFFQHAIHLFIHSPIQAPPYRYRGYEAKCNVVFGVQGLMSQWVRCPYSMKIIIPSLYPMGLS